MSAETIKANYEVLDEVSNILSARAESTEATLVNIISVKDSLMADSAGQWIEKFEEEMSSLVLPKLRRFHEALVSAEQTVRNISQELQESEDRAGNIFRA